MTNHTVTPSMRILLMALLLASTFNCVPAFAQTNPIQGDFERQPVPIEPPSTPEEIPDPDLQVPSPEEVQPDIIQDERSIIVERFEITGNTVFPKSTLLNLPLMPSDREPEAGEPQSCLPESDGVIDTIGTTVNQSFSVGQLLQVAARVAEFYACEGYSTSGAKVVIPETTQQAGQGRVEIQVIEGTLEEIVVTSETNRSIFTLNTDYVRSRLHLEPAAPLNVAELQESLQLLQLDPLIDTVSATLQDGVETEKAALVFSLRMNRIVHW